jgi:hypothetical protein
VTHPLEGRFSVEDSARRFRAYRYVVERALRALGGWIALTPELSAKLLLGRHVWDLAQHCDAFGRRLPELREPARGEPAGPGVVAFMDALESPEAPHQTVERVTGVYRVLKPHLLALYARHLESANAVFEPPTRRILARCVEDERRHVAAGEVILAHLAATPTVAARVAAWQGRLGALLAEAGGVTGDGVPTIPAATAPAAVEVSDDAREWIRLERAATAWPIPEDLADALGAVGQALARGDRAALGRWLEPGLGADAAAALPGPFAGHRVVAFAKVGRYRLVKFRLEGVGALPVVLTRWVPAAAGWRIAALEVVGLEAARPA